MDNLKVTIAQRHFRVFVPFERIAFRWLDLSPRFLEFVTETLGERLAIKAGDLSVSGGNTVASLQVKLSVFGGSTSVSMMPTGLEFDFPGILPTDQALVTEILQKVHDGFLVTFPELKGARIEVTDIVHLDAGDVGAVTHYLERFSIPVLRDASASMPLAIYKPATKFQFISPPNWQNDIMVEESRLMATAVFVSFNSVFFKIPWSASFAEKQTIVSGVFDKCLHAIGLEFK